MMTQTQRVMVIAGLAGADPRTVRRYLEGKPAHGAHLREKLAEAVRRADDLAKQQGEPAQESAPPAA